jgi:Flp pilus assembly protein CpaB
MRPAPARFPILRPPPPRLVFALVLALVAGAVVHRTTVDAAAVTARLGRTATVAVAVRAVEVGKTLEPGDTSMESRPVAHLPDGAVTDDPTGVAVRQALQPGEVVVRSRLAGAGREGAAALVPEGWRALSVPVLDAPLPARPGDRVDVVAAFDPTLVERDPSLVVAADGVVVDVADDAVTVAVPRSRITQVAFALANGIVTLALVG